MDSSPSKISPWERFIRFFLSFNVDQKEIGETNHQHAKSVLRTFFIYMIFVSNVLIVAILMRSSEHFLITNTFEYHLIHKQFPVKIPWLERDKQQNPHRSTRPIFKTTFMIDFNQITTFQDVYHSYISVEILIIYFIDLAVYE